MASNSMNKNGKTSARMSSEDKRDYPGSELSITPEMGRQIRYNEGPDSQGECLNLNDWTGDDKSIEEFPFLFNMLSIGHSSGLGQD